MSVPYLPERDLSLDRRFVARRLALALAPALGLSVLGGAAAALTWEDVTRLRAQEEIATQGVRAEHVRVDIERDVSFFLFRARRYEVSFADHGGHAHAMRVREHDVSIAPLVVEGPPEVRYDPHDPSRISVGFARQNVGAQWAAVTLLGSVAALCFALAGLVFRSLSRPWRRARGAARAGRAEHTARVVAAQASLDSAGQPTGEQHLVLALEPKLEEHLDSYRDHGVHVAFSSGRGSAVRFEIVTDAADPPCFVDPAGERVLVVSGADALPTVVRQSGHPFVLDETERRELRGRSPWRSSSRAPAQGTSRPAADRA